jgi:hypothetical protein
MANASPLLPSLPVDSDVVTVVVVVGVLALVVVLVLVVVLALVVVLVLVDPVASSVPADASTRPHASPTTTTTNPHRTLPSLRKTSPPRHHAETRT